MVNARGWTSIIARLSIIYCYFIGYFYLFFHRFYLFFCAGRAVEVPAISVHRAVAIPEIAGYRWGTRE